MNISATSNVTVVCAFAVDQGFPDEHFMEVVFHHHQSNAGQNKPFKVVFGIVSNINTEAQTQSALVDRPGEDFVLDTENTEFGLANFDTALSDNRDWIPTIKIKIPPRSKVYSLFYEVF